MGAGAVDFTAIADLISGKGITKTMPGNDVVMTVAV